LRILLTKLTDDRHRLEVVRADGSRESVTLETRSLLAHDLLHVAVEAEARLETGFWGLLARGKTLADMNDRSGQAIKEYTGEMAIIEKVVGGLTPAVKGADAALVLAGVRDWLQAQGDGLPAWLDEAFIERARDRMRRLLGQWRATPHGATMTVTWRGRSGD
jgi:hypothetical protein